MTEQEVLNRKQQWIAYYAQKHNISVAAVTEIYNSTVRPEPNSTKVR